MTSDATVLAETAGTAAAEPAAVVRSRWSAALIHLFAGGAIVGLGSYLLMRAWYPEPFAHIAGGLHLLALLIGVDIVLGPALTLVASAPGKPRRVFARDLAVILALQAAGWAYGVHSLALARPVGLVFEVDQMRVVAAADTTPGTMRDALPEFRELPWNGPRVMAAAKPTDAAGLAQAVSLAMNGVELGMLPGQWRAYEGFREQVLAQAQPVAALRLNPSQAAELAAAARAAGVAVERVRHLPLRAMRATGWVTLIAEPDARVIAHLRLAPEQP